MNKLPIADVYMQRKRENLNNAPPEFGQMRYSLMPSVSTQSVGINSPNFMELLTNVSQQFTRFAFRA